MRSAYSKAANRDAVRVQIVSGVSRPGNSSVTEWETQYLSYIGGYTLSSEPIAFRAVMAGSKTKALMSQAEELYVRIVTRLIKEKVIDSSTHILVACGGVTDHNALIRAGLTNCVISNLDSRQKGDEFLPLAWSYQDAEALTYPDDAFDFCIVHEGLHHCRSPHLAIKEMLRVSRRGILIIEPADNIFTAMGVKIGIGQEYEQAAVYGNDLRFGGVRNTCIPNYVYRFTAEEIRKTVRCLKPESQLKFTFSFHFVAPWSALLMRKSGLRLLSVMTMRPLFFLLHRMLPHVFANQVVALVIKPSGLEGLQPWLRREGDRIEVNNDWFAARYARR